MIVKKDKQFLIFYLPDDKTVKYDLSTCKTIGKSGKIVNDLRSQLRGYSISSIIDAIENDTYKKLLKYVWGRHPEVSNIGSLLEKTKMYSRYEQVFSSGLDIEAGTRLYSDIPKGLAKICKTYNIKLDNKLLEVYNKKPDLVTHLFSIDCAHLTKMDVKNMLTYSSAWRHNPLAILLEEYRYNPRALMRYMDYIVGYEALSPYGYSGALMELKDYAVMSSRMSDKFEKYPKNLLTVHKIATRNYERLKEQFDERAFQNRYNKKFEKKIDDYKFIYPKCTQDIKDEAVQQNNCVASYIRNVIDGKCHILFLRKADTPDTSLVTIEVRDNKVVQAKGKHNREITNEEREIVEKFNAYLAKPEKERVA